MSHVHVRVLRVAKPLYYNVKTTLQRRFDVIMTLLLRHVPAGMMVAAGPVPISFQNICNIMPMTDQCLSEVPQHNDNSYNDK